jgi:hypothetical protein
MAKNNLTLEDHQFIGEFNKQYEAILRTLESAKQFNLGDYMVLYVSDYQGKMQLQNNSYGAPIKYKVVFTDAQGVPFIKKVNKKGEPMGRLYSCVGTVNDDYRMMNQSFQFELDPDFADSILLQDGYDPSQLHKTKKDIWKAVTDHNKACKIPTQELKDVITFFQTVEIGDTLWTSNIGHYMVQDKKVLSASDFNLKAKWRYRTRIKGPLVCVLTVRDKSGKVKDITADYFWCKALYSERPRTYKELNI